MTQLAIDGTSTVSDATPAVLSSTRMLTCSSSATAPSSATTALIAVALAETKSKILLSSQAIRLSVPHVFDAEIVRRRSKIYDMRGHHKGFSAWSAMRV